MATARNLLTDFTGGEVSPRVDTRADLERYARSCRELKNFIPLQQGGAILRRGLQHMGVALASGQTPVPDTLLIPWRAGSADEEDILFELSGTVMRGWDRNGLILSGGIPYTVTLPVAVTGRLQWAQRARLLCLTGTNQAPLLVRINSRTNWTVSTIPSTGWPERRYGDTRSPPLQDSVTDVTFTGFSAGNTYNVYIDGTAVTRTRIEAQYIGFRRVTEPTPVVYSSSSTAQNISRIRSTIRQHPQVTNPDEVTVTYVSGTTYRITLSGSLGGTEVSLVAQAESDTRRVEIATNADGRDGVEKAWSYPTVVLHSGVYYQCILAHVSTATTPNLAPTLWTPLPGAPAWESQQPSATWSSSSVSYGLGNRGFPACCAFHEQRLVLAGSPEAPQTFWASAIGNPEVFALGAEDDQPLSRDIDAPDAPAIRWMVSHQGLVLGTSAGIWQATAEITLTPADVRLVLYSADRVSLWQPVVVGNEVLFITQGRQQLMTVRRNERIGPYETDELSALAEHLARYRLTRLVYCHQPQPVLYVQTDEPGLILAVTYSRQNNMVAFARLEVSGTIRAMTASFDPDEGDVLWVVVDRDGRTSVEKLPYPATAKPGAPDTTATKHLDGWVTRTSSGGIVSGLSHLQGRAVTILTSAGAVQGTATVGTGSSAEVPVSLTNAGFETGSLTGWSGLPTGQGTASSADARTGTWSLFISSGGDIPTGNQTNAGSRPAITAGSRYVARCYWKAGANWTAPWFVPVTLMFYDAGGTLLLEAESATAPLGTSGWQLAEVYATAPTGAATARLKSYGTSPALSSLPEVYVDDFSLALVPPAVGTGEISATGTNLVIGQAFTGRLVTMEPVGGNPEGPATGRRKRYADLQVRLYQSALPKINGNRPSDYAQAGGAYRANPGALRTGEYEVTSMDWRDGAITIEQDLPHRTEIVALYGDVKVN